MPQMAPLNWLSLFIFFVMSFMLFNLNNYFNLKYTPKQELFEKTILIYNWKW